MKRKRYTEDLEFKISDEEADDADAAGRDSPSNTSQSEQQVSGSRSRIHMCVSKMHWEVYSCSPGSSVDTLDFQQGDIHRMLANALWEISCLVVSFKKPCSLEFIFIQVCDM